MTTTNCNVTIAVYQLIGLLPHHDYRFSRADLPDNGIYLVFEQGETLTIDNWSVDRIVRIGTHRGSDRLPKRLRQHFAGNRRGSIFRRHLGGALLNRADPTDPRLSIWTSQKRVPIPEIEQHVTETIRAQFTFACLQIDDLYERLEFERKLIALLATAPLSPPTESWLGRSAVHPTIRQSGLWNTLLVATEPLAADDLNRLDAFVRATL